MCTKWMLTGSLWVLVKTCLPSVFLWDSAGLARAQQGGKVVTEKCVMEMSSEHLSAPMAVPVHVCLSLGTVHVWAVLVPISEN